MYIYIYIYIYKYIYIYIYIYKCLKIYQLNIAKKIKKDYKKKAHERYQNVSNRET